MAYVYASQIAARCNVTLARVLQAAEVEKITIWQQEGRTLIDLADTDRLAEAVRKLAE